MTPAARARSAVLVLAALCAAFPARLPAQSRACADSVSSSRAWPVPLDRRVTLRATGLSLRDALDQLSRTAGVQLSYASEVIGIDRRVCVRVDGATLGDVLLALLATDGAEPVVVGDQVVLAAARDASPRASVASTVAALERVVVTGTSSGAARRPLPVAIDVIDGRTLSRENVTNLAIALNGSVPGAWMWERAPSSLLAQYGSVRGASSFSTTYPKVYLDGIEVANPLLITQVDPDAIDRIELIRGPQGAALYGSDAISGVMNVVTRHEGSGDAVARGTLRSEEGVVASRYALGTVATHTQRLALHTGSNLRSAGLSASWTQTGAYIPASESRRLSLVGDSRIVGSASTLATTLRLYDVRAGAGQNPLVATPAPAGSGGQAQPTVVRDPEELREYTVGTTATLGAGAGWTHTVIAGLDGYHLNHAEDASGPFPSSVDSALRSARGSGDRASFRASSTARLGDASERVNGSVTVGLEHSVLRQRTIVTDVTVAPTPQSPGVVSESEVELWRHDTGILAQASASLDNAFFVSAGVRAERNDAFGSTTPTPILPMLGVAWVHDADVAQFKLRAAYGKGIRAPQTPARDHGELARRADAVSRALEPEEQSGVEFGAELYLGRTFSMQVTRFDQAATGLLQNVVIGVDTAPRSGQPQRRVQYELQNVGEITNRGWELQGTGTMGAVQLTASYAAVDSRVRRIADRYLGDLRPGDRMLAVPTRTASLGVSWHADGWSAVAGASRAIEWTDYDRLALARTFLASPAAARELVGPRLRAYWRPYDGGVHLRGALSVDVRRGVSLVTTGENLLGYQLGEPDDITVRPGRTVTAGLRASF